jgi:hypothetical protein
MNLDCLAGHDAMEPDPRAGFAFSDLRAAACPECDAVVWWNADTRLVAWDGLTMGIGQATIVDRISAVSAPSQEVVVCRTPPGFRLGWLPRHRWVEAAPDVFLARSGRHLLLSSPTLDVAALFNRPRVRHRRLVPVG